MKFELTPEQAQEYNTWDHFHCCNEDAGTIGGKVSFKFTPTGLGVCVQAMCICGAVLDLTDSENW